MDVFVSLQTLLLLVLDVELEDLLDVSLDLLSVWIHLVSLNHNGKE